MKLTDDEIDRLQTMVRYWLLEESTVQEQNSKLAKLERLIERTLER